MVAMSPTIGELAEFFERQEDRLETKTAKLEAKMEEVITRTNEERDKVTAMMMQLLELAQEEKAQLREEHRREKAVLEEKMDSRLAATREEMEAK